MRRLLGLDQPQMPYGGPPLPPEQIELIKVHRLFGTVVSRRHIIGRHGPCDNGFR